MGRPTAYDFTCVVTGTFKTKVLIRANGSDEEWLIDEALERAKDQLCGDDIITMDVSDFNKDFIELDDPREER